MRRAAIVAVMLVMMFSPVGVGEASAEDDAARTFIACVARSGDVRRSGDDLLCRHITSTTMRTYLAGTTACSEEVQYEIWQEIRSGTVTFAFHPGRVILLPEDEGTWPEALATPVSCLDD